MTGKYEYKATELIAQSFEEHGLVFNVAQKENLEILFASFPIDCGPEVIVMFISRDNDNDVAVRIHSLIFKTPPVKWHSLMEACNRLNSKIRYVKFYLDIEGDINVEYDLPVHTPDEALGEMATEIFFRMGQIMNSEYKTFMHILYSDATDDFPKDNAIPDLLSELEDLQHKIDADMKTIEDMDDNKCEWFDLESVLGITDDDDKPDS